MPNSSARPLGNSIICIFRKWISAPSDSRHKYPFLKSASLIPLTNFPLIESDCSGCYGKYSPKSLNSRLPFEFAKFYDTWRGRRTKKSLDYFGLELSQSEDFGISLVNKKLDKYNLYFFKDVLRQLKNEMGVRDISQNDRCVVSTKI